MAERIVEREALVERLGGVYASGNFELVIEIEQGFDAVLFEGSGNRVISSILRTVNARVRSCAECRRRLRRDGQRISERSA
jgi:DNA-binding GntR family transcriptional regulator